MTNKIEEKKEIECKHSFLPKVYNTDLGVYGTDRDEDIFMNGTFIIVECSECNLIGYIMAEVI